MSDKRRYYVHGDEVSFSTYYCAKCDTFSPLSHFTDECTKVNHYEKYLSSLESWKSRESMGLSKYIRPDTCYNIFKDEKPKETKKSPFYKWIIAQIGRDDPVGDVAKDIKHDKNFPLEAVGIREMDLHVRSHRKACEESLVALREAWLEFKGSKPSREGMSLKFRFEIFRRDFFRCQICGATAQEGAKLEVDHKNPISKGGTNEESNLWTLCFACNRGKGVTSLNVSDDREV